MNPLFALPLYADNMSTFSVLFWRYLFAIPIILAVLKIKHQSALPHSDFKIPHLGLIALGLCAGVSSLTLFESYNWMDAGIASTLVFVYPIMVAVIMAIFFRERLSLLTYGCIAVALLGVCLLCRTAAGAILHWWGITLVLLSALSYAVYIVCVNLQNFKHLNSLHVTLYVLIVGVILYGSLCLFNGRLDVPHGWLWVNAFCLALFPTAISFFCTTAAIGIIGSTPTAILGVLEPLTAVAFGVTVFHEHLATRQVIGLVLNILAVLIVIARKKR